MMPSGVVRKAVSTAGEAPLAACPQPESIRLAAPRLFRWTLLAAASVTIAGCTVLHNIPPFNASGGVNPPAMYQIPTQPQARWTSQSHCLVRKSSPAQRSPCPTRLATTMPAEPAVVLPSPATAAGMVAGVVTSAEAEVVAVGVVAVAAGVDAEAISRRLLAAHSHALSASIVGSLNVGASHGRPAGCSNCHATSCNTLISRCGNGTTIARSRKTSMMRL